MEEALAAALLEAATLYDDIVNLRIKTPLGSFSEVDLLYLLGLVIRRQYGYGYFARALEAASISIDESNLAVPVKAVALWFVGMIGLELDKNDAMKFLVESFDAREVPLVVALAVSWESAHLNSLSIPARVRSFNKHVRKILKARSSVETLTLKKLMEDLSKKPIDPQALRKSK